MEANFEGEEKGSENLRRALSGGGRGFGGFENQFPPNGLKFMEAIREEEENEGWRLRIIVVSVNVVKKK